MKSVEQSPVKIGIVGCGRATTELHLPALQFVPGAKVAALADSDPATLITPFDGSKSNGA